MVVRRTAVRTAIHTMAAQLNKSRIFTGVSQLLHLFHYLFDNFYLLTPVVKIEVTDWQTAWSDNLAKVVERRWGEKPCQYNRRRSIYAIRTVFVKGKHMHITGQGHKSLFTTHIMDAYFFSVQHIISASAKTKVLPKLGCPLSSYSPSVIFMCRWPIIMLTSNSLLKILTFIWLNLKLYQLG